MLRLFTCDDILARDSQDETQTDTFGSERAAEPTFESISYSQKIRPGRCPDPEIIALRVLMINQAQEVSGRFPASLIYVADREPIAGCPVNPYAASLS